MSTCSVESDKQEHPKRSCWWVFALGRLYPFSALNLLRMLMNLATIDGESKVEINYSFNSQRNGSCELSTVLRAWIQLTEAACLLPSPS